MPGGRPTDYTEELALEICETVATHGYALKKLCDDRNHWPHRDTIYSWLRKYPKFADMYGKAKRDQVNAFVDQIVEISDDSTQDTYEDDKGNIRLNSEFAARSRLRVDTRKWIAAKLVPRLYGDNSGMRELYEEIAELKKELAKREMNNGRKEMDSESD